MRGKQKEANGGSIDSDYYEQLEFNQVLTSQRGYGVNYLYTNPGKSWQILTPWECEFPASSGLLCMLASGFGQ